MRRGGFAVDVGIDAPAGEVTAVLGPNGAGKSTLLACLAGLLAVDEGHVTLDGVVLDDRPAPSSRPSTGAWASCSRTTSSSPTCRRSTTWPSGCGAPVAGGPTPGARPAGGCGGWASRPRPGCGPATSRAGRPSGSLWPAPSPPDRTLLLLDEPLGALDAGARVEVRRDLRRTLADHVGPVVLVTHDPVDALALADRVVVVEQGRAVQSGPIDEVTARPRSRYVADLLGTNLLRGTAADGVVTTAAGATLVVADPVVGPVFATVAPGPSPCTATNPRAAPATAGRPPSPTSSPGPTGCACTSRGPSTWSPRSPPRPRPTSG